MLTRYLYPKEAVEFSLVAALVERKTLAECYYWLDELVVSGYDDVKELFWKIFYDFYFEYHPKLESYILRKTDMRPVVRQLFRLSASPTVFRRRMANESPPTLDALANGRDVQAYWEGASSYINAQHRLLAMESQLCVAAKDLPDITYIIGGSYPKPMKPPNEMKPYHVLETMRCYAVRKDIGAFINSPPHSLAHWEYDAYETPLWKARFERYGGVPNNETRRIDFPSDDELEAFYDEFGYEPDEQTAAVQAMGHPQFTDKIEIKLLQLPPSHPKW
jgi:hypothetical protein